TKASFEWSTPSKFLDRCSHACARTNLCLLRNLSVFLRGTLPRHEQELKRHGWRHQQEQRGLYGKTKAKAAPQLPVPRSRYSRVAHSLRKSHLARTGQGHMHCGNPLEWTSFISVPIHLSRSKKGLSTDEFATAVLQDRLTPVLQ